MTRLRVLHQRIDREARAIQNQLPFRLRCQRGCSGCCVDDLTVLPIEAQAIRAAHAELLAEGAPHPQGACAFLDQEGACRIYDVRPYVCRTQGLPLRWVDPEAEVERRDICRLHDPGERLLRLEPSQCWSLGPVEAQLAALHRETEGRFPRNQDRVSLRSLFDRCGP